MACGGVAFRCNACDAEISDETYTCKIRKRQAYLSGISDCVQKIQEEKKRVLVCSCGENVGEFVAYGNGLKYCLDLEKVKRCSVTSNEDNDAESSCSQGKTVPLQTQLGGSALSRKIHDADNKLVMNSGVCGGANGRDKEIMQLKKTVTVLEERIKLMERDNMEKFKDLCGMLLSQKLQIQRLQEIIWALHPNVNLGHVFTVDDEASYFESNSDISHADIDIDED